MGNGCGCSRDKLDSAKLKLTEASNFTKYKYQEAKANYGP